mmetsp:Transcript_36295/g.51351  ORF Transcript_36295/g.51351 Transcript_36295/m.51351 type:complete len:85 (+) Transcript_36295:121-375(+)
MFSGTIPSTLSQLKALENLFVYRMTEQHGHRCYTPEYINDGKCRGLTGTVPEEICKLPSLQLLVVTCKTPFMDTCPENCCQCFY